VFPDDSVRWIQERAQRVCGANGTPLRLDGITADITDRVGQRERLERLARIRELLGATNAAIVRLRDRGELFAEFCRIAVEIGGFLGGRVLDFEAATGRLRVAVATDGWGALGEVVEAYNRDPQGSQSLLADALRTGQPVVSNDLHADLKDRRREVAAATAVRLGRIFPALHRQARRRRARRRRRGVRRVRRGRGEAACRARGEPFACARARASSSSGSTTWPTTTS
jgi:hypothetical protein